MDNIFLHFSVILGITVTLAFVVRFFRQPMVTAYIISGLVAGPLFLNLFKGEEKLLDTFSKFGIVLLLFFVGLSLNFDYIKKTGKNVLIGALVQFFFSAAFAWPMIIWLGLPAVPALFLALALTFSSTIVVTKILGDKGDLETVYGRYTVGILLIQDILAIIVLLFLNSQKISGVWYETALIALTKAMVLISLVFLMSKYVLPFIMRKVAKSGEMLFIFTIAWCFGVASMVYAAGFNLEIGAIIAGISLGASDFQSEISSKIKPLKDFFIVLFFIALGSGLSFYNLHSALFPALAISIFVLVADPLILYFVMRRLRYTRHNAFLVAVTSAQVSEFGFVLLFKGKELGIIQNSEMTILVLIALFTLIVSSYLITYNEEIYRKLRPIFEKFGKEKYHQKTLKEKNFPVWIFGYHRIGWKICEALTKQKTDFAVVDYNPETVEKLKKRKIPAFYGDAADVEFLENLPIEKAKIIISTIPQPDDQKILITHIRRQNPNAFIIASLYHNTYLDDLYEAGADYIMMPHLLTGEWLAEMIKKKKWTKKTFHHLRKHQKTEMKLRYTEGTH